MSERLPLKVLHVAAEVFPIVKTGGLADVVAALPPALAARGADVRMLLPGLPPVLDAVLHARPVLTLGPLFGAARVDLKLGQMPQSGLPVYVLDAPYLFRRDGGPYQDRNGQEWPDNLQRFAALGWTAAHLAFGELDLQWQPDVLHAHDWHAAMACAYIAAHPPTPAASVYTVHNLAYQGLFPADDLALLSLPSSFKSTAGLEYHGQLSFMKAGLRFSDRLATVSPNYAREMTTPEFGAGLDGAIRGRGDAVHGIINGIDTQVWDPSRDSALVHRYRADSLEGKAPCKAAVQAEYGLKQSADIPLIAVVTRLTSQKGLDLVLAVVPELLRLGAQLVVQGTGDHALESALSIVAQAHPESVAVYVGYDEARAHRLIGGADIIMVPSRFEPCGLTQLYGLRYGTVPLVRQIGGLADTVIDGETGYLFDEATPFALQTCLHRTITAWHDRASWQRIQRQGMALDLSWDVPAVEYLALYDDACEVRRLKPRSTPSF